MPVVSRRQRRAMFAAAHGKSTLGIPRRVGEEFVGKRPLAEMHEREMRTRRRFVLSLNKRRGWL